MPVPEIPAAAPNDAIMAKPAEIRQMNNWMSVFGGTMVDESNRLLLDNGKLPFSFTCGGVDSKRYMALIGSSKIKEDSERVRLTETWTDEKTGLVITAVASSFKHYPAVDWVLYFENTGTKDSPIIENIQAADLDLMTADATRPAILHRLHGDACGAESFIPYDTELKPSQKIEMAPAGGRSSNTTAFPFFNFEYAGQGIIAAVGWSGQWHAAFDRSDQGPTRFTAGMEKTHLVLHPGERIRTPRIVIMHYTCGATAPASGSGPVGPQTGDITDAQNRWRRFVLDNYCPKIDGRPIQLPIALQNFDRYIRKPGWATEDGQLASAKVAAEIGCDAYWFDAGWFPGDFPKGVGNWFCKPREFPNGLKPLGDECDKLGLSFILWFEPERVAESTQIATEHPEFCLGNGGDRLFNLGDPKARKWLTDLLSSRISEWGIDVFRNDFNMDPLGFWRAHDAPDRQGMTEIRYVEGHYAMWDELRARHPGLWIDNCASGGRRIDIETLSRSVPLWRSDTCCQPNHQNWDQTQNCAIAQYVPLFTGASWSPDAYTTRSVATGGGAVQWGYMDEGFSMALAKQSAKEMKQIRKFWYGDIYPLTSITTAEDQIIAWQLHRSDLNEGIILAFRRDQCAYAAIQMKCRGLDPKKTYKVEFIDDARKKTTRTLTGTELLANFELHLPTKRSSLLVHYKAE